MATLEEAAGALSRDAYALVIVGADVEGGPAPLGTLGEAAGDAPLVVLVAPAGPDDRWALLGEAIGGVAHDFNNLLTAVTGYAQLLEADPDLNADQRDSVDEILQASGRAADVTRALLAYGRRPAGAGPVDLRETVGGLRPLLESALGRRVALRLDLDAASDPALVDHAGVQHALLHLVLHARDLLGGRGAVTISASAASRPPGAGEPPGGPYVIVEVRGEAPEAGPAAPPPVVGRGPTVVEALAAGWGGAFELERPSGGATVARLYLPAAGP